MIVVDDAHRAEPALLDLLPDLVARLRDAPVLVVVVARPDLLERAGSRVERGARLTLRPLSAAASKTLLLALAGGRLRARGSARSPRRREATRCSSSNSSHTSASAARQMPSLQRCTPFSRHGSTGSTRRSAPHWRSERSRATVHARSVHSLAVGVTRADVERACDRLVERDLLVREARADRLSLRFRHTLIRDVAYASLAKSARAGLHERYAAWLEEQGSELPEADARIGFHLESACRFAGEVGVGAPHAMTARAGRGSRRRPRLRMAVATLPARLGFSIAPSRCSAVEARRARSCFQFSSPRCSSRASQIGPRRSQTTRCRSAGRSASRASTLARAIEREHIRLSCHPETFRPELSPPPRREAAETLRALGDELGLARAAYLRSRPLLADRRPDALLRARGGDARCSPAGPAATSTPRRRSCSWPGAWSRARVRRTRRSSAATRWRVEGERAGGSA